MSNSTMKHPALPVVVLFLGIGSIVMSYVWLGVRQSSTAAWTEADEAEFNAAMGDYYAQKSPGHSHGDTQAHSHGPAREFSSAEAEQATERFDRQRQKLQNAANRGHVLSYLFWWGGVLLTVAGAGGVFAQRFVD